MPRNYSIEEARTLGELEKALNEAPEETEVLELIKSPVAAYITDTSLSHLPNVRHLILTDTPINVRHLIKCVSDIPKITELTISSDMVQPKEEETLEGNISALVNKLPNVTQIHVIDRGPGTWNKNSDLEAQFTKLIDARPAASAASAGKSESAFFTERKSNKKDGDDEPKLGPSTPEI